MRNFNLSAYKFLATASVILLSLSSCTTRTTPAPVVELYQGKDFRDFEQDGFTGNKYKVQKGDTLFSIAWYSGNDYRDLAKANNISTPYAIYPGQEILLNFSPLSENEGVKDLPGQTSKTNANRTVDRSAKQAYGESNKDVNKLNNRSKSASFPNRVERWLWPSNGQLISKFSLSEQGSKGIEIKGKRGDSVVAAADGKVVYTGNALRGYGQLIIIKHSESFLSAYAHNDSVLVKEQQWIKAGQTIASMGSTGTDQIKLRFEVRYRGKSVDPMKYLPSK